MLEEGAAGAGELEVPPSSHPELHPAVAFGAVLAGAGVLGAVGALLALPAAATFQAFVSTYLHRHEVIGTDELSSGPIPANLDN